MFFQRGHHPSQDFKALVSKQFFPFIEEPKKKRSQGDRSRQKLSPAVLKQLNRFNSFLEWHKFLRKNPEYKKTLPWAYLLTRSVYLFAKSYFRLQVRGIKNIPYGERFLWTHNHSGWVGLDAMLIGYLIAENNPVEVYNLNWDEQGWKTFVKYLLPMERKDQTGDWGVTFWNDTLTKMPIVGTLIKIMHGHSVKELKNEKVLEGYRIYATPAEGEEGNSKSSLTQLYRLQRFRRGPARIALEAGVDHILPVTIVGPEESFPSLFPVRMFKKVIGTIFPFPAPIPPLPVQWVVRFCQPVKLNGHRARFKRMRSQRSKMQLCEEVMVEVKDKIQKTLDQETKDRKPFQLWPLAK